MIRVDVRKHFRMANGRVSQGWLPLERLPFLGNLRKMVLSRPEGWKVRVRRSQVSRSTCLRKCSLGYQGLQTFRDWTDLGAEKSGHKTSSSPPSRWLRHGRDWNSSPVLPLVYHGTLGISLSLPRPIFPSVKE